VLAIQAKKKRYKNSNKGKGRPREKETREEDSNKKDKRPTTKPTVSLLLLCQNCKTLNFIGSF
jgi:hypothetical protein